MATSAQIRKELSEIGRQELRLQVDNRSLESSLKYQEARARATLGTQRAEHEAKAAEIREEIEANKAQLAQLAKQVEEIKPALEEAVRKEIAERAKKGKDFASLSALEQVAYMRKKYESKLTEGHVLAAYPRGIQKRTRLAVLTDDEKWLPKSGISVSGKYVIGAEPWLFKKTGMWTADYQEEKAKKAAAQE